MLAAVCAWGENCIKMCAWKPARNVDLLFLLFFFNFYGMDVPHHDEKK